MTFDSIQLLRHRIDSKKKQLIEVRGLLRNFPYEHPDRPVLLERMNYLEESIPEMERNYRRRSQGASRKHASEQGKFERTKRAATDPNSDTTSESKSRTKPQELPSTESKRTKLNLKEGSGTYRSPVRRAIQLALTQNPTATNRQVCGQIDEDGSAALPKQWSTEHNRSFETAWSDKKIRHKIESVISKVRHDMREWRLL